MPTYFCVTVLSTAFTSILRTSRPFTSKCVPWWNLDCNRTLHVKCAAWCSFRPKLNTPGHLSAFISFRRSAIFRKTKHLKKHKLAQLFFLSPLSAIWRRIHKISGKHPHSSAPVLHINNEYIVDPLLVANELGSFFSKISSGSHLPS